ncbi:MAG: hypothetical protein ACI8XG_002254, partial [Congregibacter sp.]
VPFFFISLYDQYSVIYNLKCDPALGGVLTFTQISLHKADM